MRRLVISDLHFGNPASVAAHPEAVARITEAARDVDEVVINGDLFELLRRDWRVCVDHARPLMTSLNRIGVAVRYLAGNHDHRLVSLSASEHQLDRAVGDRSSGQALPAAYRLLRSLAPSVEIQTSYPFFTTPQNITVWHGHHYAQTMRATGIPPLDEIRWKAWASGRKTPSVVPDSETYFAAFSDAYYHLFGGSWTSFAGDVYAAMDAPGPKWRLAAAVYGRRVSRRLRLRPRLIPPQTVLALMAAACAGLRIPAGIVCFGHVHRRLGPDQAPGQPQWRLIGSGCWVYDRILLDRLGDQAARPGTCLLIDDAAVSRHDLLADLTDRELLALTAGG